MKEDICFVIMPFDDDFRRVYDDAIKEAVEESGLKCVRVDEISGTGNIVRRIVESIHNAKVIIADLTGKKANVFYELGVAHALGNNVIVLAQNLQEDVPFDVGNYKVIKYDMDWGGDRRLRREIGDAIDSLSEWSTSPSNPVQDFLPPEARPVPYSEYKELEDELEDLCKKVESTQDEYKRALDEKEALQKERERLKADYERKQQEVEALRKENDNLRGPKQFMENMLQAVGTGMPELAANADFEEEFDQFLKQLAQQDEVDVSIPVSRDQGEEEHERIIFTRVKEEKEKEK